MTEAKALEIIDEAIKTDKQMQANHTRFVDHLDEEITAFQVAKTSLERDIAIFQRLAKNEEVQHDRPENT